MSLFGWIGSLFKPATDLVDSLDLSGNERAKLENALAEINSQVAKKMLEYDMENLKLQGKVAESASALAQAETRSDSAFVRLYKPAIIFSMFILILLDSFLLLPRSLPEIFVQVFGAAFGVVTIAPTVTEKILPILNKRKK